MRVIRHTKRLLREFVDFARENKAWWIIPIVVFLLLAALAAVATSGSTPLIYTLF